MSILTLTSPYLTDGEPMPKNTAFGDAGGDNRSPSLSWQDAPSETKSYALTLFDPDEPTGVGFVHWVLFNIDSHICELPEGAGATGANPPGSELGFTDLGEAQYGGPAPTPGAPPHRYQFTIYARDIERIDLKGATITYAMLQYLMRGHVLAEATLTPTFETPAR